MDKSIAIEVPSTQPSMLTEGRQGVQLSAVIPISERFDDLRELYAEFDRELAASGRTYEFIFVVDGSQHHALGVLRQLRADHEGVKVIVLNRSFGEAAALSVGFQNANGEIIVTLAPYFQIVADKLRELITPVSENVADMAIARRYPRTDSIFNRLQGGVFNWQVRAMTGTPFHDLSCGVRVLRRAVAEEVPLYGDLHRFFPLLAYQRGFKVFEIPAPQDRRDEGRRLNRPGVYMRRLLDIATLFFLFKFTMKPLRFFGLVGSALFIAGSLITGYLGAYRLFGFGSIADRPLLVLGVLLIVLGIQLFSVGLLGEIIIFTHAGNKKQYNIREILE